MKQRGRVEAAIEEVGFKAFKGLLVPAVLAASRLINDPKHKGHTKAVLSTLSRLGLVERTGVDVQVSGEVAVSHTEASLESLRALKELGVPRDELERLYGYSGLERYEAMLREKPKLIEGEVVKDVVQKPE